jgi:hypothetical protein
MTIVCVLLAPAVVIAPLTAPVVVIVITAPLEVAVLVIVTNPLGPAGVVLEAVPPVIMTTPSPPPPVLDRVIVVAFALAVAVRPTVSGTMEENP